MSTWIAIVSGVLIVLLIAALAAVLWAADYIPDELDSLGDFYE